MQRHIGGLVVVGFGLGIRRSNLRRRILRSGLLHDLHDTPDDGIVDVGHPEKLRECAFDPLVEDHGVVGLRHPDEAQLDLQQGLLVGRRRGWRRAWRQRRRRRAWGRRLGRRKGGGDGGGLGGTWGPCVRLEGCHFPPGEQIYRQSTHSSREYIIILVEVEV